MFRDNVYGCTFNPNCRYDEDGSETASPVVLQELAAAQALAKEQEIALASLNSVLEGYQCFQSVCSEVNDEVTSAAEEASILLAEEQTARVAAEEAMIQAQTALAVVSAKKKRPKPQLPRSNSNESFASASSIHDSDQDVEFASAGGDNDDDYPDSDDIPPSTLKGEFSSDDSSVDGTHTRRNTLERAFDQVQALQRGVAGSEGECADETTMSEGDDSLAPTHEVNVSRRNTLERALENLKAITGTNIHDPGQTSTTGRANNGNVSHGASSIVVASEELGMEVASLRLQIAEAEALRIENLQECKQLKDARDSALRDAEEARDQLSDVQAELAAVAERLESLEAEERERFDLNIAPKNEQEHGRVSDSGSFDAGSNDDEGEAFDADMQHESLKAERDELAERAKTLEEEMVQLEAACEEYSDEVVALQDKCDQFEVANLKLKLEVETQRNKLVDAASEAKEAKMHSASLAERLALAEEVALHENSSGLDGNNANGGSLEKSQAKTDNVALGAAPKCDRIQIEESEEYTHRMGFQLLSGYSRQAGELLECVMDIWGEVEKFSLEHLSPGRTYSFRFSEHKERMQRDLQALDRQIEVASAQSTPVGSPARFSSARSETTIEHDAAPVATSFESDEETALLCVDAKTEADIGTRIVRVPVKAIRRKLSLQLQLIEQQLHTFYRIGDDSVETETESGGLRTIDPEVMQPSPVERFTDGFPRIALRIAAAVQTLTMQLYAALVERSRIPLVLRKTLRQQIPRYSAEHVKLMLSGAQKEVQRLVNSGAEDISILVDRLASENTRLRSLVEGSRVSMSEQGLPNLGNQHVDHAEENGSSDEDNSSTGTKSGDGNSTRSTRIAVSPTYVDAHVRLDFA